MRELFDIDAPASATHTSRVGAAPLVEVQGTLDPATVIAAIRHRWWVGALSGLSVIGLGGAYLQFFVTPTYSSRSVLEVKQTLPTVAVTDDEWRYQSTQGQHDDYLRTIVELATTHEIMEAVVDDLEQRGIAWRPELVEPSIAPAYLGTRVVAKEVRNTNLLTISIDDANAAVVAPIVNSVATAIVAREARRDEVERLQREESLMVELDRVEEEMLEINAELMGLYPTMGVGALSEDIDDPILRRVAILEEGLTETVITRASAEGLLDGARAEAERLSAPLDEDLIAATAASDSSFTSGRTAFDQFLTQQSLETGQFSKAHPDRARALWQLDAARSRLSQLESEATERARVSLSAERVEQAESLLLEAESRAAAARKSAEMMTGLLEKAQEELTTKVRATFEVSVLRERASRVLAIINLLESRLEEVRIESHAGTRVSIASSGVMPLTANSTTSKLLKVAVLGFTFLLLLGVPVALELLFPRLRSRDDLGRIRVDWLADWTNAAELIATRLQVRGPNNLAGVTIVPGAPGDAGSAEILANKVAKLLERKPEALGTALTSVQSAVAIADRMDSGIAELCSARGLPVIVVTRRGASLHQLRRSLDQLHFRRSRVLGAIMTD